MSEVERFAFPQTDNQLGMASSLPYLPLTLNYQNRELTVSGLLDTGATINVMPYQIGLQLGASWEQQTTPVQLTGNLANLPAYGLIVTATVARFPPIRLAFAWTLAENVPLILGQVNFFLEFDVCFFSFTRRI
ncbi:hypothetical protein THIOM_000833 [Candidatus Thiomargarita nelsonii]|uniref:Peptidase A2 domain-containing protein n=1 Tax=Candidatus Thiomargarita nelsonii TaxID=1003181 RepID=A0A176S656_9GAMM|nr:hypothetical protein THIOM_000833 [Candidatus Thiomargarita nelsonii]